MGDGPPLLLGLVELGLDPVAGLLVIGGDGVQVVLDDVEDPVGRQAVEVDAVGERPPVELRRAGYEPEGSCPTVGRAVYAVISRMPYMANSVESIGSTSGAPSVGVMVHSPVVSSWVQV